MKTAAVALIATVATGASAETQWVGRFDAGDPVIPAPWKVERIDQRIPPTEYALRAWDGVGAVEARADKSMAILGRPLEVDLQATPILCWQWRIDAPVAGADMTKKSGDDYAARVYLNFDVPPDQLDFGTRTKLALGRTLYGDHLPDAALNTVRVPLMESAGSLHHAGMRRYNGNRTDFGALNRNRMVSSNG